MFLISISSVEPLDFENNRVSVVCKPELEPELGHLASPKIVSDQNLSRHVRQMALHSNLAAVIHVAAHVYNRGDPYASNWLERLRHIKRLKGKVLKELKEDIHVAGSAGTLHDFTGMAIMFTTTLRELNGLFFFQNMYEMSSSSDNKDI